MLERWKQRIQERRDLFAKLEANDRAEIEHIRLQQQEMRRTVDNITLTSLNLERFNEATGESYAFIDDAQIVEGHWRVDRHRTYNNVLEVRGIFNQAVRMGAEAIVGHKVSDKGIETGLPVKRVEPTTPKPPLGKPF